MRLAYFLRGSATAVALTALLAGTASAQILHNNGPVVPPSGYSAIRAGGSQFGATMQTGTYSLADDFAVTGGWNVTGFSFFGYQIGTNSTFTFTGLSWSIVAGNVNTGSVMQSGSLAPTNGGLMGYRVSSTGPTNMDRAIFQIDADVPDFALGTGSYWLRWSMSGSLNSGPFNPSTSDGVIGNAQQGSGNAAYAPLVDDGDRQGLELPFIIRGTPTTTVPEPSTWSMMVAGGLAMVLLARRRRRIT